MSSLQSLVALGVVALLTACVSTGTDPATGSARHQEGGPIMEGVPHLADGFEQRLAGDPDVHSAILHGWLPGGVALVGTRFGETAQVHQMARPMGARRPLTFFDEPVVVAVPSPDPERPGFLYLRDEDGSGHRQLYHLDLDSGRSARLSDGVSRNAMPVWDRQGNRLAWSSTARNGRDTDIWIRRLDGAARPLVTAGGAWFAQDFSADGSRLLVLRYVARSEVRPYVVDVDTGTLTPLLARRASVRIDRLRFGPDSTIYISSDLGGEVVRLYRLTHMRAEPEAVTPRVGQDLEQFELSPDGRFLAWSLDRKDSSRLYVRRLDTGAFVALPELPRGRITRLAFTVDGNRLGFSLKRAAVPGDVHSIDLRGRTLTRWTRSEATGLASGGAVHPRTLD